MVHMTYRVNPNFVEGGNQQRLIKEGHFWISDDKGITPKNIRFSQTPAPNNSKLAAFSGLLQDIQV
jgi:hypothetical protein